MDIVQVTLTLGAPHDACCNTTCIKLGACAELRFNTRSRRSSQARAHHDNTLIVPYPPPDSPPGSLTRSLSTSPNSPRFLLETLPVRMYQAR